MSSTASSDEQQADAVDADGVARPDRGDPRRGLDELVGAGVRGVEGARARRRRGPARPRETATRDACAARARRPGRQRPHGPPPRRAAARRAAVSQGDVSPRCTVIPSRSGWPGRRRRSRPGRPSSSRRRSGRTRSAARGRRRRRRPASRPSAARTRRRRRRGRRRPGPGSGTGRAARSATSLTTSWYRSCRAARVATEPPGATTGDRRRRRTAARPGTRPRATSSMVAPMMSQHRQHGLVVLGVADHRLEPGDEAVRRG